MENDLAEMSDATLEGDIMAHWRQLFDIVPLLPEAKALETARRMKRLFELYSELQTRMGTGTMDVAAKAEQLGNERDYLRRFLLRAIEIGAEQNIAAIRPLAESVCEYLEAWEKQKLPSEEELRSRFDTIVKDVIARRRKATADFRQP